MSATYPDLAGKRVLVTGASSGIGRGIALAFLGQRAKVAVHHRTNAAAAAEVAARFPGLAFPVLGDLSVDAEAERAGADAAAALGGLDAVVHSAGIWEDGTLANVTGESLERMFRTNTFSAFYLARDAARHIEGGSLVYVGSTAGERGEPRHAPYAASKAALRGLVHSLAQELGPAIRVNQLSPGWVRTPMAEAELTPEAEARITSWIPDRRLGTIEDCANAALFLVSDVSGHLVGVDLEVSGGALLPIPAR